MSTDIPHPDRLGPGDMIGPWRILEVLGAGGLGRVFKVEHDGMLCALKMATRLPGQKMPGEEDVDGRCTREATMLLGRTPHPNIPRLFQVGRWPDPEAGYLYVVMEFIDGWRFHDWRYETHPTAARLVDVMLPIVRTVAELHKSGVHHRDLNANNVVIRKEDDTPFVLDYGSVSLPGARSLTQGLPPVDLSVAPPEAFEQLHAQGEDARFRGGPTADLYALGVLFYGALTDGLPFNPELPPERLVAAITLRVPRAPHRVNPKVPKSLSLITMRLLAKRPEDRFESAESLYTALWEANKARTSREWKVPLDLPESGPAPVTDEEMREQRLAEVEAPRAAQAREREGDEKPLDDATDVPLTEDVFAHPSAAAARRAKSIRTWERVRRPLLKVATACALMAGLVTVAWWSMTRPDAPPPVAPHVSAPQEQEGPGQEVASPLESPEARAVAASPEAAPNPVSIAARAMFSEDSASVTTHTNVQPKQPSTAIRTARRVVGAAITCSALTGCPGAQVRPAPPSEECPPGAVETMANWGIKPGHDHLATFETEHSARVIAVSEGRTTLYITGGQFKNMPAVELSGRLIFGDRIYGRLTGAKVNGRTAPVCFELEDLTERVRGLVREPNGSADTAKVFSSVTVVAVRKFE
ncbi:serine/threonine-protein kinase [Myxococcus sp. RHSTA-1-4]|uniref:serine/threonine protein kinase n=1 Tax=Myxococcus sp. RHSTA-1-4 TaxID=2874601 RepID=UPI001CBF5144|nr:serine/threonine-protein kinase [Myxococcus sp. RHSTA-1-4]MBZ4416097.1 protein kinase [Myxococcus sp. RHSTA-1-4]